MTRKKISKKDLTKKVTRLKNKIATVATRLKQQQSHLSSLQLQIDELRRSDGQSEALAAQEQRQQELAQTTEALIARVNDLAESATRLLGISDELRSRIAGLETQAAAAPGSGAEQLRRAMDQDERIRDLSALPQRLDSLQAELQRLQGGNQQLGTALEQTAAELRHRAQALEDELRRLADGQETLELKAALLSQEAEEDAGIPPMQGAVATDLASSAQLAGQLEAIQQHLSDLASEAGQLRAAEGELTRGAHALEQRLGALRDAQALDRSRLEGILTRTDALEQQAAQQSDQSAAVLGRLDTLSGELQALRALRTDERLDGLERSMRDERARIGELQQTEQALGERLSAVIGSAEGLFERLDSLSAGSGQLSEDIERLDQDLRNTSSDLNQQRAGLQAHESRLGALDEAQQALHTSTESLGVQQARQDNDTRDLQQGLRQRSILGLLAFLLTAAVLGFLLLRDPGITQGPQQAMQAGTPAAEAATAIAELQRETAELRQEVVQLGTTVAQIRGSVDLLDSTADPEMPEQVDALSETVQMLVQAQSQQPQEHARLEGDQQQLRAQVDQVTIDLEALRGRIGEASDSAASAAAELPRQVTELKATVENLVRENLHQQRVTAGLQAGQAQMQATLAGVVEDVRTPGERPAAAPAVLPTAEPPLDERWERARKSGHYTLQVAGFFKRESLQWFVQRHRVGDGGAVHQAEHRGRKWYVLFYGIYETVGQAVAAARQLPAGLAAQRPWVRRIPPTGNLSPL